MKTLIVKFPVCCVAFVLASGCSAPLISPSTPTELLVRTHESCQSVQATFELLQVDPKPAQRDALKRQADEGIALAGKVIAHADVTSEQVLEALTAKCNLLFPVVREFRDAYDGALEAFAKEVMAAEMDVDLKRVVGFRYLVLRCSGRDKDFVPTETSIFEFARIHPGSEDAVYLVALLADRYSEDGKTSDFNRVYRKGRDVLHAADRLDVEIQKIKESRM